MPWQGTHLVRKKLLKTIAGLDKSSVTSFAIDGKVWLGTRMGQFFLWHRDQNNLLR